MDQAFSGRVGIAGLGNIGRVVARAVHRELPGLTLAAAAARRPERAQQFLRELGSGAEVVPIDALASHCNVVVEAAPSSLLRDVATPVLSEGKQLVLLSCGALLSNWDLVDMAKERNGQILVPTGALVGLDAVLAAAEGNIEHVQMVTRKPVESLRDAPFVKEQGLDLDRISDPVRLFAGPVRDAIQGFPANLNVAVALSLAGVGPDRTELEVWVDPALERNAHRIRVSADSASMECSIQGVPSEDNPRTAKITALSVVALLRKHQSPLALGT